MKNTGPTRASVNDVEKLILFNRRCQNLFSASEAKIWWSFLEGSCPLVPQTVPLVLWESTDCHEPKKCWGATKGSSKAVLSSLSSPDISSFTHVCAAVWGFMNMPGRPFSCCKLHAQTSPVHSLIYIWQGFVYCIQVQNMILDIHKASSEFITQQLLQQIIPISSQKRNLWTALVLKERSFWKHILSQKKMKAKKLILTWFITPFTSCNTSIVLCVMVWSFSPFSSKSPCF